MRNRFMSFLPKKQHACTEPGWAGGGGTRAPSAAGLCASQGRTGSSCWWPRIPTRDVQAASPPAFHDSALHKKLGFFLRENNASIASLPRSMSLFTARSSPYATKVQEWTGSLNRLQISAAHRGDISVRIYHLSYIYLNNQADFRYCCIFNTHFLLTRQKNLQLLPRACWQLTPRLAVA